jgi:peptidoglycan hydrolase CwlO-like protein|tara:strand:+ start:172 stop:525 length:354 start_codon:yes stop_codon:yes gene_type:complete
MKKLNISENTSVGLPLKNLLSLIAAIVVGSYFAFGVLERLNNLETADILFKEDLLKRAEQEPKNLEMFMLIEHLAGQIEDIEEELKLGRYNKVNIDHLKEQVNVLQKQIDKLRNGGH